MSKFYNIDKMVQTQADYKYLMGGRNIGKSYQIKKYVLTKAYETNKEFIYLRRYKEDMKNQLVTDYFGDMDIINITNGEYSEIYTYQSNIYFINRDDSNKPVDKKLIGRAHCLSTAEHQKSIMYPNVNNIIFEEFIPEKGFYLSDEPSKLQSYVSTIARTRKICVWLVGNTISKLCPYFSEWGLDRVNTQKLGTIDVYKRNVRVMTDTGIEEDYISIAIERCKADGLLSKMTFGSAAEMIANNEWVTDSKPLIEKKVVDLSTHVYYMIVKWANLKFKCEFLKNNDNYFWYVCPLSNKKQITENDRVITDDISPSYKHTTRLRGLNEREQKIFNYMSSGKIFYSDNTTGTDFENVLKQIK